MIVILEVGFSSDNAVAGEETNDIFTVVTMDRKQSLPGPKDDYYYWITFLYSHVENAKKDSSWSGIRNFFVDKNKEIVFQVQQETLSGGKTIVKANNVLSIFKSNENLVSNNVKYGSKMIPERRFQNADTIKIRVSLSQVTEERASSLRLILGSLEQVPFVNSFTAGSLTLASTVVDTLTGLTAGPGQKSQIATYTIQGVDQLAKIGYIAIVAKGQESKFNKLVQTPGSIPKTINDWNDIVDKSTLPSFVLLKIESTLSMYSPTQILSVNSPVLPLIKNEVDAIKNAQNNTEKAKQCVQLRSALNFLGPLSSLDEGYAAMAALKHAGYDPEKSAAHQNESCLTYQEIEAARTEYSNFKWGACISSSCRATNAFVNLWIKNKHSDASANTISWFSLLGGTIKEGSGTSADFRAENRLRLRWGDLKTDLNNTYSVLGAMFGTKDDKPCTYDVKVILSLINVQGWKIDHVDITETKELLHGSRPSDRYIGVPKCSP